MPLKTPVKSTALFSILSFLYRYIDHHRVPDLETFFNRHGKSLSLTDVAGFQAGDIVTWRLPGNLPHIGIVSDKKTADGIPLIIHNIGNGTQEEDIYLNIRLLDTIVINFITESY